MLSIGCSLKIQEYYVLTKWGLLFGRKNEKRVIWKNKFFWTTQEKTIVYCEKKFKQIDLESSFQTDSTFSSSKNKLEKVVFEEICLKYSLKTH